MLYKKQLRWQIYSTMGAVFLILLTIVFVFMMIKSLGTSNRGQIAPQDIIIFMALSSVLYLPHIVIIAIFISTIIVLTNWYEKSEMVVWQVSGLSLFKFLNPIMLATAPFFILLCILTNLFWPWSNTQIDKIKDNFKRRSDISLLVSGKFFEIPKANKVLFLESYQNNDQNKCQNSNINCKIENIKVSGIFAANMSQDSIDILSAKYGEIANKNGQNYVVLNNGNRHIIHEDKINYMSFNKLYVKTSPTNTEPEPIEFKARSFSSKQLWQNKNAENLSELSWRFSLPIAAVVLQIWALALAHSNPRKGKYFNIILAVVIYLVYNNLINIMQIWVAKQKTNFLVATFSLHLTLLIIGISLLLYRSYGFYIFNRVFAKKI